MQPADDARDWMGRRDWVCHERGNLDIVVLDYIQFIISIVPCIYQSNAILAHS